MIDRPLVTPTNGHAASGLGAAADVLLPPHAASIENDDGSVDVIFADPDNRDQVKDAPFASNLAEYLPDNILLGIANDIRYAVDEDLSGRKDWEDALTKGMDLLGIKDEDRTTPWPGACGVVHPMILEAAVRFQSKAIMRLFPPEGPAQAKIEGEGDETKIQAAKRVAHDLNFWLTDKMLEYRDETEQLLFAVPVDGSAFKKSYYDPILKRPVAQFVPANDFVMPYGFPNLETCPRYTHVMRKAYSEVRRLQEIGFFCDIPLNRAPVELDRLEEKVVRLSGVGPSYSRNELLNLWECTTDLVIEDESRPYVVTLESDSNRVLSIYRNWREGDPDFSKVISWTHYRYVPWKGPYGLGLIHLIGSIGHSSTSILRQLVDAGTLSNLPGGLKARTLRIKGDDDPIQPGEWRDVDVPSGKIADSIYSLPYKEPSAVLFQLLQMLVEEGKSFASIAELDINSSTQNAPVGTVLALIERATEVITAVQSRMHTALGRELTLIAELIRDHTPGEYDYDPPNGAPRSVKRSDYHQGVSIIPVSDPAASSMAQRVMEYQAALQLSAQAPQLYNLPLLHRSMIEVLGIDNAEQIVPDKTATEPLDPVSENMALLNSKPIKAFQWQDHQSHIQIHFNLLNDPSMKQAMSQNPLAASIDSAAYAHINEHLAFEYRKQIEEQMGTQLPAIGSKLPAEVEEQLSGLIAQASQKLLNKNQQEEQAKQAQQAQQDPLVQLQQQEMQIKQAAQQQKARTDQGRLQLEAEKLRQRQASEAAKMASNERQTAAKIQAENQRHAESEVAQSHREHHAQLSETTRHLMTTRVDREKNQQTAAQTQADAMEPAPPKEPPA